MKQNDISVLVKKKQPSFFRNSLKEPKTMILIFDSVAYWIFPVESHLHKTKCQIDTFHEVLPGNLVFFHFYYCGTIVIEYLDQTTALYRKNYISTENFTSGIQNLFQTSRDQCVYYQYPISTHMNDIDNKLTAAGF